MILVDFIVEKDITGLGFWSAKEYETAETLEQGTSGGRLMALLTPRHCYCPQIIAYRFAR